MPLLLALLCQQKRVFKGVNEGELAYLFHIYSGLAWSDPRVSVRLVNVASADRSAFGPVVSVVEIASLLFTFYEGFAVRKTFFDKLLKTLDLTCF